MSERTKRKRSWLRRFAVLALVLVVAGVVGWLGIQRVVKSSLESQLATFGIGTPEIGNVSISTSGIRATEIKFVQSGLDREPTATVDMLVIHHSLFELITSSPIYDSIDIAGLQVFIEIAGVADPPMPDLKLKSFSLPARKLNISNSAVILRNGPERTFDIREIDLSIVSVDDKYETSGIIASMIDGRWIFNGQVDPGHERLAIELKTEELALVNHRWQKWPFILPVIEQTVHGDARMKARVLITSTAEAGLNIEGVANIDSLNLRFPWFDNLPVNIYEGDIEFQNNTVYYKEIVATVDGSDRLHGNGETTVDKFPMKVKFDGDFRDLDVTSLRKLVAGIPGDVQGKATGDVTGLINIEASTRTTLGISSDALCSNSRYGKIDTEPLNAETRIVDLVFDENQYFESVDGFVAVNGTTPGQPINNIFETFELTELQRRLELDGDFVSDVAMRLPLKTISDLATWQLSVDGKVEEATICGQAISAAQMQAELHNGDLHFRPVSVTPLAVADTQRYQKEQLAIPKLNIAVEWPLIESASGDEQTGRVWASGERVPTAWIRQFIDRQIENATRLKREEIDPDHRWAFEMLGQLNFETDFGIPAHSPDSLELWTGTGMVTNSTAVFDRLTLGELSATLGLDKGLLSIRCASGSFGNGGRITADGHIDVRHQVDHDLEFSGRRLPFSWAAMLAADASEDVKGALVEAGIDTAIENGDLAGELSADLKFTSDPASKGVPWTVRAEITSERLGVGDEFVRNLRIEGYGIPDLIHIESLHVDLVDDGYIDAQGELIPNSATANGSIEWQRLPVNWVSRFAHPNRFHINGRTNGNLVIRSIAATRNDASGKIPIEVDGNVTAEQFGTGQFDVRPFSFDVATREGAVHIENVRTTDKRFELNLHAQAELTSPFQFAVVGNVDQLKLDNVLESAKSSANDAAIPRLTGQVSAGFTFTGQIQPFDWQTKGKLSMTDLAIDGRRASDVSAVWNHSNSDWNRSTFSAQILGGTVCLTELAKTPQRLHFSIADVDLQQLDSLVGSPGQVVGVLSGTALLTDWGDVNTMKAGIELQCQALSAQQIRVRDLVGRVEFQNRDLSYSFEASAPGGKIDGSGKTELTRSRLQDEMFPMEVRVANVNLKDLSAESRAFRSLETFAGNLSAIGNFNFQIGQTPSGSGRIEFKDLGWKNQRFVKDGSSRFAIKNDIIAFDDVRADLEYGSVTGRAVVPVNRNAAGTYEFEIRQMNLGNLTELVFGQSTDVAGQLNARINGRLDREISGQGFVAVQRASIHGLEAQAFRLPVRFTLAPQNQSGKIEVRQSTFRLFNGKATASGTMDIGPTLNVETNIQFANVDTGKLLGAIADLEQVDQGKMSGQLILKGRGIRSTRDLAGSFKGKLTRASAFELPVLQDISRFMTGNNIKTKDYDSDEISMQMNKGRIEVNQLNFANSFAKIAIRGDAWLDGRLNLQVAARVDKLGQPTLIEELAGSPLAGLTGSPVAFLAQAADFLSERVVFLRVNGTFRQPQVRPDSGQQIADEVIRYFLRGSQILPNGLRWND